MPSDTVVLAFDTSAAHCAAALLSGGRITIRVDDMAKGQAEHLVPMLGDMMRDAGLRWADLTGVAVGIGPGNFTGIRISVAAARGIALALERPAVGVSTLEAQTFGLARPVLSCVDARQGVVYAQFFHETGAGPAMLTDGDLLLPAPGTQIVGPDADRIADRSGGIAVPPVVPLIEAIARIGAARRGDDHPARPHYIRPADAAPARDMAPVLLD